MYFTESLSTVSDNSWMIRAKMKKRWKGNNIVYNYPQIPILKYIGDTDEAILHAKCIVVHLHMQWYRHFTLNFEERYFVSFRKCLQRITIWTNGRVTRHVGGAEKMDLAPDPMDLDLGSVGITDPAFLFCQDPVGSSRSEPNSVRDIQWDHRSLLDFRQHIFYEQLLL